MAKRKNADTMIAEVPTVPVQVEITEELVYQRLREGYYECKLPYPPKTEVDYIGKREVYTKEDNRLGTLFREEALEAVGFKNHPKAGVLYGKAWEDGHAYGYHEVMIHLVTLADLVKEINKA